MSAWAALLLLWGEAGSWGGRGLGGTAVRPNSWVSAGLSLSPVTEQATCEWASLGTEGAAG